MFKRIKRSFRKVDPIDVDFELVYSKINRVEGFLKSPKQERWFFGAARSSPDDAVIVEIGSFKGRSTVSFAFGCVGTKKHVFAIDLFEGDGADYGDGDFETVFMHNINSCGLSQYITPIRKHSLEVASTWEMPIDILFIDGSHEYNDVKADFEAFYPHVKKNGIIAFHDIKGKWDGVIKFWNEVLTAGYLKDVGKVSSLGYGRKK